MQGLGTICPVLRHFRDLLVRGPAPQLDQEVREVLAEVRVAHTERELYIDIDIDIDIDDAGTYVGISTDRDPHVPVLDSYGYVLRASGMVVAPGS